MNLMFSTQANGLSNLMMDSNNQGYLHVSFEPVCMSKKDLRSLKEGDLFFMKKSMPKVYIVEKNRVVGQAKLGMHNDSKAIIIEATEHMSKNRIKETKYINLWPKFSLLKREEFRVGNLISLGSDGDQNIILYHKSNKIATANMLKNETGYILELKEIL